MATDLIEKPLKLELIELRQKERFPVIYKQMVEDGLTEEQIAKRLQISTRTLWLYKNFYQIRRVSVVVCGSD